MGIPHGSFEEGMPDDSADIKLIQPEENSVRIMMGSTRLIVSIFVALAVACVYAAPGGGKSTSDLRPDFILGSPDAPEGQFNIPDRREENDSPQEQPDSPQEQSDLPRRRLVSSDELREPQPEGEIIPGQEKGDLDTAATSHGYHHTYYSSPYWNDYYGRGYGWGGRLYKYGNGWRYHSWY